MSDFRSIFLPIFQRKNKKIDLFFLFGLICINHRLIIDQINSQTMSSTTTDKKKSFTNYRVFGFWLMQTFKEQGIIDQSVFDELIRTQETFGSKENQEAFYAKFFDAIPQTTSDLKELAKTKVTAEKEAAKEAAKAAKLAEKEAAKEAAKAAKLAEKEAAKEAAKAAKLAEKEAAKATKLAEKEAAKAAKVDKRVAEKTKIVEEPFEVNAAEKAAIIAENDEKIAVQMREKAIEEMSVASEPESPVRPNTPLLPEEYETETDVLMSEIMAEVIAETNAESLVMEVTDAKKKKTMYIKRPVQINNHCFVDSELKTPANALCVLSEANEESDPIFQYVRGKKTTAAKK